MKILVVDDSAEKIRSLINFFTGECSVLRSEVDVARSASEARTKLKQDGYDLMVLDLLLPFRDEDEPSQKSALDLLSEISNRGNMRKPSYVVGCTAYENIASSVTEEFRQHTWTLVRFDPATDEWKSPLSNCIKYIKAKTDEITKPEYIFDVCIVCALQSELDQVLRLPWEWGEAVPLDDNTFVQYGIVESSGQKYRVAASVASRMGMVATALLCSALISKLRPRYLIMAGICAGITGKANIGDIILADPSWDWQSGKHSVDDLGPNFSVSPHQLPIPTHIRTRGHQLAKDVAAIQKIKRDYNGPSPSTELNLRVAPMASGSAVLADADVLQRIKTQERNLTGVEMEVYGVYAAAAYASSPRPTAFAMKSVCDFGDKQKNDDHQRFAAYTSAKTVELYLERYLHEIISLAGT